MPFLLSVPSSFSLFHLASWSRFLLALPSLLLPAPPLSPPTPRRQPPTRHSHRTGPLGLTAHAHVPGYEPCHQVSARAPHSRLTPNQVSLSLSLPLSHTSLPLSLISLSLSLLLSIFPSSSQAGPRLHYRLLTLCPAAYRPCAPGPALAHRAYIQPIYSLYSHYHALQERGVREQREDRGVLVWTHACRVYSRPHAQE